MSQEISNLPDAQSDNENKSAEDKRDEVKASEKTAGDEEASVPQDEMEDEDDEDDEDKYNYDAYLTGLDAIKVCINDDPEPDEDEILTKKLNLRVSTWMELYKNLEKPESMADMRDVCIDIAKKLRNCDVIANEFGSFAEKFEASAPYNFFLTTVTEKKSTFNQSYSVSFHEILDYTLGELDDSLHINYTVELSWIVTEYMIAAQNPKMTVLYNVCMDPDYIHDIPFGIEFIKVQMPEFGCFHSKISILKYKDNRIRIIISSANLYALDWQTRTQGLWISPFLPLLPLEANDSDGESATNFKRDFIEYLNEHKEPQVFGWIALMHRTDFSAVKVFFLGSVPGSHQKSKLDSWGRNKLAKILSEHVVLPENAQDWPVVAQSSAVGSFGPNFNKWLLHTVHAMSREKKKIVFLPKFKYVYPSKNNYMGSYDDNLHVTCLMYSEDIHSRQTWLNEYLYQWKADKIDRNLAMPHLKSYTRISPDGTEIPWFVLTSANIGKGAWGKSTFNQTSLHVSNYEAGVVFIPQFFIKRNTFPINESNCSDAPVFRLPYDVPLTPYNTEDEPFYTAQNFQHQTVLDRLKEQESSEIETLNLKESETSDKMVLEEKATTEETT